MCILEKAGWNGGLNYHTYQLETEIENVYGSYLLNHLKIATMNALQINNILRILDN